MAGPRATRVSFTGWLANTLKSKLAGTLAWTLAGTLALLLTGCAAPPLAPVLHQVGQADPQRPHEVSTASAEQTTRGLHIERAGQPLAAVVGMLLASGDVIESGPHTLAVVRFPEGHELTLLPQTRVRLGSAWLDWGEIYVRKFQQLVQQLPGQFKVKTRYVTAGVEGTAFWVRLAKDDALAVGVVEGRVSLASVQARWQPVALGPSEVATVLRDAPPSKDARQRAEVDRIVLLMRSGLRLLPPRPPPVLPRP